MRSLLAVIHATLSERRPRLQLLSRLRARPHPSKPSFSPSLQGLRAAGFSLQPRRSRCVRQSQREPHGQLACAAAHAVVMFNTSGCGDVKALVLELKRACHTHTDASSSSPSPDVARPRDSALPGSVAPPSSVPTPKPTQTLSAHDLCELLDDLSTAHLVGPSLGRQRRALVGKGDSRVLSALNDAVKVYAAGGGLGSLSHCIQTIGHASAPASAPSRATASASALPTSSSESLGSRVPTSTLPNVETFKEQQAAALNFLEVICELGGLAGTTNDAQTSPLCSGHGGGRSPRGSRRTCHRRRNHLHARGDCGCV